MEKNLKEMTPTEAAEYGYSEGQKQRPPIFDSVNLIETLITWLLHLAENNTCKCEMCQRIRNYLGKT